MSRTVVNGEIPSIEMASISQNNSELAAKASSSRCRSRMFEQFASKIPPKKAVPIESQFTKENKSTADADVNHVSIALVRTDYPREKQGRQCRESEDPNRIGHDGGKDAW